MGAKRILTSSALALGLAALWAGPALADSAPGKAKKDDPSRRICRSEVPSGSRLTIRTCRTKAEWDEARDRTQEGLLRHQTNESSNTEQDLSSAGSPP